MSGKGFGKSDLKTDRVVITGPFCAHYEDGELIVEGEGLNVELSFLYQLGGSKRRKYEFRGVEPCYLGDY